MLWSSAVPLLSMGQAVMPQPCLGLGQTPQEQQQDQLSFQELLEEMQHSVHVQYLEELQDLHVRFKQGLILRQQQQAHQIRDLPLYQVYEADIKKKTRDLSNLLYDNGDLQIPTVERSLFSNLLITCGSAVACLAGSAVACLAGSAVACLAALLVFIETTKKGKSQEASSQSQRLLKKGVVIFPTSPSSQGSFCQLESNHSAQSAGVYNDLSDQLSPSVHSDQSPSVHNDLSDQLSPSVHSDQTASIHNDLSDQLPPSVHSDLIASVNNDLSDQLSPSVHSDQSPSVHSDQSFPSIHSAILGLSKTDNHSDLCFLTTGKCFDINNECKVSVPIFWACGHNLGGPPRPHYQREELA